jgi:hypothetical protein
MIFHHPSHLPNMKFDDIHDDVFSCCNRLADRIGATTNEVARVQLGRDNLGELEFRYAKGQILFFLETREGYSTKFPLLGVLFVSLVT